MSNRKSYHLNQSPFFRLRSKKKLAKLLYLSLPKLKNLSREANSFYLESSVYNSEKKKRRKIEVPQDIMRNTHDRIKDLMGRIEVPSYIFSPGQGGSTIKNALFHQSSPQLYKIDIKKYFPSITQQKIYNFFCFKMQCSKDVSAILAEMSTFSGHLSTGSPLSPVMSYHVNADMWEEIYLRTLESNCKISVWVDDICISGSAIPKILIWDVKKIIRRHKFEYHKEKLYRSRERKNITGIIVSSHKIMARKGQYKKLRELRKKASAKGDDLNLSVLDLKIQGLKNYIEEVEKSN